MDAQAGSRALSAADDLAELLHLAQSAAERLSHEVHGPSFDHSELIAHELKRLRRSVDKLHSDIGAFVAHEEGATVERGHPLRRASDRGAQA
jgi:hypothetical protein